MTKTLTPFLIAAAALTAGCGSSGSEDSKDSLTPQQVIDQYRTAVIEGDGQAACDLVADSVRTKVVEDGGSECVSRFSAVADQDTPEDTAAEKAMHPKAVVNGDKATAKFKTLGGDPTQIVLEKQDGAWRVVESPELENFRISNG